MTELENVIVTNGEVVAAGVSMVICGCAVDHAELDLCPAHKSMDEASAVASISADYGIEATTTTKEEVSVAKTKKVSFKDLKAQAVAMGVDIKGLRSIKAVQAAMEAFVAPKEEAATTEQMTLDVPQEEVAEPVAVELDYTSAITEYATELLTLVSKGTDYNTLAKRVSVNAYSILGAQVLSGAELTTEQKEIMARHGMKGLGLDKLVSLSTVAELKAMSGTQLYIFGLKIGAKPKLVDIESLREQLITLHGQTTSKLKEQVASEASRANAVSTRKPFSSAHAVTIYPNAVAFIADNEEYIYIINPQGKGVLRHGNSSSYMNVKHLKGLLFNINTNASRKLVQALGKLRATKPSQAGGAPAKEKNSTATKEQNTMTVRYNKESYSIPMDWYKQFVSSIYASGHKGSITAAMIVEAWTTRK